MIVLCAAALLLALTAARRLHAPLVASTLTFHWPALYLPGSAPVVVFLAVPALILITSAGEVRTNLRRMEPRIVFAVAVLTTVALVQSIPLTRYGTIRLLYLSMASLPCLYIGARRGGALNVRWVTVSAFALYLLDIAGMAPPMNPIQRGWVYVFGIAVGTGMPSESESPPRRLLVPVVAALSLGVATGPSAGPKVMLAVMLLVFLSQRFSGLRGLIKRVALPLGGFVAWKLVFGKTSRTFVDTNLYRSGLLDTLSGSDSTSALRAGVLREIFAHPTVWGNGLGPRPGIALKLNNAHNVLGDVLFSTGAVGVLVVATILLRAKQGFRSTSASHQAIGAMSLLGAMFSGGFFENYPLWLMAGVGLSGVLPKARRAPARSTARMAT